jgi:hypothetical protein
LVTVREKKNIQTPSCHPSGGLSELQLNKSEGSSSVAISKTLSNSSREGRKPNLYLAEKVSHNGTCSPKHSALKEDFVFVLNKNGKALMPTKSGKARRMLKSGIAKVVSRSGQKTRYRKARFLNRRASISKGRIPPSVKHIVQAHFRERNFVNWILPESYIRWNLELASFDIHRLTNPEVTRFDYQKGPQKDFYNIKAFVLHRDSHSCQKCFGKKKYEKLHVHHIAFRSSGGSDSPDNLVTLCETCHSDLHSSKKAEKESLNLRKSIQKNTKGATQVSIVASQLRSHFGEFKEAFGYETKFKRELFNFKKSHHIDAVFISATDGEAVDIPTKHLFKRLVSRGDYQQTSGARSEKKIPTGKLFRFRKFDLIQTSKGVGLVKGKRSSGYFTISDISGNSISDSVNVKKNAKRLSARKTVLTTIMEERFLPDLKDGASPLEYYE